MWCCSLFLLVSSPSSLSQLAPWSTAIYRLRIEQRQHVLSTAQFDILTRGCAIRHGWEHWFDCCDRHWGVFTVKRRASMQFLDLQGLLRVTFSHRNTYLYVNCHLISYVLSQLSCFHTNVPSTRRVHARVHRIKDGYLHTFWLMKTCFRVKFNISHRVLHLTFHWCTWNDVIPHESRPFFSIPN